MKMCLDVGNSQIYGGVFEGKKLLLKFRHETHRSSTSDQLGIFLKSVLRENNMDAEVIKHIAISSVVPPLNYSLGSACIKYFKVEPFWLQAGVKTGLKIKTKEPNQVGADLIASAIASVDMFPNKNLIVSDFGTATTFAAINKQGEFLGVVIQAGVRTSMHALQTFTEKLPTVQIVQPKQVLGRDTTACIQSGLYYGQLGATKEILAGITKEVFAGEAPVIIGTGGFSTLYENEQLFSVVAPDLVLHGIRLALELNL
jgi:type III pantothenate kinase